MGTIDPEKLRKQLDEVWISLAREADAGGREVMRACALTLITVVEEEDDPEAGAETLAALMREHPGRTILIRLAAGGGALLEADVEARCWMPFGGRQQICSEQIVIRCSEKTLPEVPGVVLPLVVADLPVVLWCSSPRACRSEAFGPLAAPAGRVIVDTLVGAPRLEAWDELADQSRRGGALVADLSWTRLTRWRALLAQVFENELYRRQLPYFCDLAVHYEGTSLPPTALLLAGWLASTLGWQWAGRRLQSRQAEAQLRFERHPAASRPGRLSSFELMSRHDPATRIVVARSGPACGEVRVEVAGLEPVMNRVSLPPSTSLLLVGEELAIHAPDPVFERSLQAARQIVRTLF